MAYDLDFEVGVFVEQGCHVVEHFFPVGIDVVSTFAKFECVELRLQSFQLFGCREAFGFGNGVLLSLERIDSRLLLFGRETCCGIGGNAIFCGVVGGIGVVDKC